MNVHAGEEKTHRGNKPAVCQRGAGRAGALWRGDTNRRVQTRQEERAYCAAQGTIGIVF